MKKEVKETTSAPPFFRAKCKNYVFYCVNMALFSFKHLEFLEGGLRNMWFLRSFALWRDQQINVFSFFGLLAAPGVSWGPPGGLLGASWGSLGASWGSSGGPPLPPGALLGPSSGLLGSLEALLEPRGTHVGLPEPELSAPGD